MAPSLAYQDDGSPSGRSLDFSGDDEGALQLGSDIVQAIVALEQQLKVLAKRQERHMLLTEQLLTRDGHAPRFAECVNGELRLSGDASDAKSQGSLATSKGPKFAATPQLAKPLPDAEVNSKVGIQREADMQDGTNMMVQPLELPERFGDEMGGRPSMLSSEAASGPSRERSMLSSEVSISETSDMTWSGWLKYQINSERFDIFFGVVIFMNVMIMAAEQQWLGHAVGWKIGFIFIAEPEEWADEFFRTCDAVFTVIFTIEVCLRLYAKRLRFFYSAWNILDLVIIVSALMHTFLVDFEMDTKAIRLIRLARLTRCLRMLKVASMMDQLHLIVKSVNACWSTLFWSMLILIGVQWVCGMLLFSAVLPWLQDESNPVGKRVAVYNYYGTFTKTMITMFEITHVNYSRASRVLQDNISENFAWFFAVYRMVVSFAILQVIRAVFIQQTLQVANFEEHAKAVAEKKRLRKELRDSRKGAAAAIGSNVSNNLIQGDQTGAITAQMVDSGVNSLAAESNGATQHTPRSPDNAETDSLQL
mmetsp:Transcript_36046/g.92858  ORF Transcript_36046/g.92858 Transcript_36046/m.92858 type:complete len:534 (-) Transcript_36046:191-1792(-)|eukprot:CAMPEP_0195068926 /NCGR_PEP_ID=MMETSP0448-20130528/13417_1 /TAXON_ID=66468 /ORGANISM="Heterocapsa triquestra, Strain CCMP 448" /LENGTH=533 /DNA_ID=CAMNT_0040100473 /DNA_START=51 /DNA_END=1652 /DNA_ORIENTATION=-